MKVEEQIKKYHAQVLLNARQLGDKDENLIDDLIQEGHIAIFNAVSKYKEDTGPFTPYVIKCIKLSMYSFLDNNKRTIRIPMNKQLDEVFMKSVKPPYSIDDENINIEIADIPTEANEEKELIQKAISTLNENEQEIINLYFGFTNIYEDSLTLKEIGELTNTSKQNIALKVSKILSKLKTNPTLSKYYQKRKTL
jgi:RNA polymerase sigma factor (sigma-70 family)